MPRNYVQTRIEEALKLAKGNTTKARTQLIAWCKTDQTLLQALTKPHMTGIVAHAINYVLAHPAQDDAEVTMEPQSLDMAPETFGKEILKVLQNSHTPRFGQETSAPAGHRPKASQSHIDALKTIAGKKKKKK